MYDDLPEALMGARAAGMATVGVYDGHARVTAGELERAAEAKITDELSGLVSRLQQSGLDAPGFGTLFSKSMPEVYAPLSVDWGQAFRTLDVVVSADVRVTKSSAGPAILTTSG